MKPCECIVCRQALDAATAIGTPSSPKPGDATACIQCGTLMIFADDLTLRAPNAAEASILAQDKDIQNLQAAIAQLSVQHRTPQ